MRKSVSIRWRCPSGWTQVQFLRRKVRQIQHLLDRLQRMRDVQGRPARAPQASQSYKLQVTSYTSSPSFALASVTGQRAVLG